MKSLGFTKRETIALIFMGLGLIVIFFVPQFILDKYEFIYLLFVVVPLGYMIATDPERKN